MCTSLARFTQKHDKNINFDARGTLASLASPKIFFKDNHSQVCCRAWKYEQVDTVRSIVAWKQSEKIESNRSLWNGDMNKQIITMMKWMSINKLRNRKNAVQYQTQTNGQFWSMRCLKGLNQEFRKVCWKRWFLPKFPAWCAVACAVI